MSAKTMYEKWESMDASELRQLRKDNDAWKDWEKDYTERAMKAKIAFIEARGEYIDRLCSMRETEEALKELEHEPMPDEHKEEDREYFLNEIERCKYWIEKAKADMQENEWGLSADV